MNKQPKYKVGDKVKVWGKVDTVVLDIDYSKFFESYYYCFGEDKEYMNSWCREENLKLITHTVEEVDQVIDN